MGQTTHISNFRFLGVGAAVAVTGICLNEVGTRIGDSFAGNIPAADGSNDPVTAADLYGAALPEGTAAIELIQTGAVYVDKAPSDAANDFKTNYARWEPVDADPEGNIYGRAADFDRSLMFVKGHAFSEAVAPAVTAGAYVAGDIMGGLMEFSVARQNGEMAILQEVQIALKAAVTPSLLLVLFNADPSATTKTDNDAYSLNVADAFKVIASLPINNLGGYLTDHGTPNTIRLGGLSIPLKPAAGSKKIYALLVDQTGVTLASVGDLQVRLSGIGV